MPAVQRMDVEVISAAMRAGCILLTLELASTVIQAQSGPLPPTPKQLDRVVARAAGNWLEQTGLAAQLPPAMPVVLQVRVGQARSCKGIVISSAREQFCGSECRC